MQSAAASSNTSGQHRLHLFMGTGNDVSSNEAVAHALAGIGTGTNSGIHCTGFTTHHHRDVTTAHILTANQLNFRRLCHRVSGFDGGDHSAGLDHAQGNALH